MSKQASANPSGSWKMILLLIIAGAAALMISPVSAETGVTIAASGVQSYYYGEEVILYGNNSIADTTYLFVTGPNLPSGGVKLALPHEGVVSGDPATFTAVKTRPDNTWKYTWYTANIMMDAGVFTIFAAGKPTTNDLAAPATSGRVSIILKRPFVMADVSPATVTKGQPLTVWGTAEGNPPSVQIWIIGNNYHSWSIVPVNPDSSFRYVLPGEIGSQRPGGQYFAVVQHPMQNNIFEIAVSGDYVTLNNDTNLLRISGPGSVQGTDLADALSAAMSDHKAHDDTYTIVPFQVTSPASADSGVTITASGVKSYYQGEKVVLSGYNFDSDSTYLFITGPGIPVGGGKLSSPRQVVVSGNPGSFETVKTNADKSWEYVYYTHNLNVDAGSYTVYAVSQPKGKDPLNGISSANISIILKKPFITAELSPSSVLPGQPLTVRGTAEGNPPSVQIWIIGDNYVFNTTTPVNPDASFTFIGDAQFSGKLPKGQCYLIVQHSMQNNTFDIVASGDYVRSLQGNSGMNLFMIKGAGSLQGSDAAAAIITALSDSKNGDDTFTVIPFMVDDAGTSVPQAQPITTTAVPNKAQTALLPFALIGAVVLILGIVVWKRQ
jgi:hypothetical protein